MPGIEIVSRTQRIIVLPNTSVSIVKQGPTGPQGIQGETGPAGAPGPAGGPEGPAGEDGKSVLNGEGAPDSGLGTNGDFYIDILNDEIYGPKTAGDWGAPTSLIGPPGADGPNGADGAPGADGKTIRNGGGAPDVGLGVDGDFYIDTTADEIYGPKTAGDWGAPTSLIGPMGPAGADGADGADGAPGERIPVKISATTTGLTTAVTAYTSGDQVGNVLSFAGAVGGAGETGLLVGVSLLDEGDVTSAIDVVFFNDNPGSPAGDNVAFAFSDAEMRKAIAIVALPGMTDLGANRFCSLATAIPIHCVDTTLYAVMITRTANAVFSANADLTLTVHVIYD